MYCTVNILCTAGEFEKWNEEKAAESKTNGIKCL